MDAIEPSNYEQAGWSDLTYEYVQALRTALDAEKARADAAEAALKTAREALAGMLAVFSPYPREDTEGWREEHEACKAADFALALIKEPRT